MDSNAYWYIKWGQVKFVKEQISGKTPWRKIAGLLEELKTNDTLIVSELFRLVRSMLECMETFVQCNRTTDPSLCSQRQLATG